MPSTLRVAARFDWQKPHRLWLVAGGTVWRLFWAPDKDRCREEVERWVGSQKMGKPRFKVRLARTADLETISTSR